MHAVQRAHSRWPQAAACRPGWRAAWRRTRRTPGARPPCRPSVGCGCWPPGRPCGGPAPPAAPARNETARARARQKACAPQHDDPRGMQWRARRSGPVKAGRACTSVHGARTLAAGCSSRVHHQASDTANASSSQRHSDTAVGIQTDGCAHAGHATCRDPAHPSIIASCARLVSRRLTSCLQCSSNADSSCLAVSSSRSDNALKKRAMNSLGMKASCSNSLIASPFLLPPKRPLTPEAAYRHRPIIQAVASAGTAVSVSRSQSAAAQTCTCLAPSWMEQQTSVQRDWHPCLSGCMHAHIHCIAVRC